MPQLFTWNDSYSVNVKEMDQQHQKWFDLLNKTHSLIDSSADELENIIEELIQFTSYHLRYEEELLETHQYPKFTEHKVSHEDFEKKVFQFQLKNKSGDQGYLATHLTRFLLEWIVKHIKEEDKDYGVFLNEKGIN